MLNPENPIDNELPVSRQTGEGGNRSDSPTAFIPAADKVWAFAKPLGAAEATKVQQIQTDFAPRVRFSDLIPVVANRENAVPGQQVIYLQSSAVQRITLVPEPAEPPSQLQPLQRLPFVEPAKNSDAEFVANDAGSPDLIAKPSLDTAATIADEQDDFEPEFDFASAFKFVDPPESADLLLPIAQRHTNADAQPKFKADRLALHSPDEFSDEVELPPQPVHKSTDRLAPIEPQAADDPTLKPPTPAVPISVGNVVDPEVDPVVDPFGDQPELPAHGDATSFAASDLQTAVPPKQITRPQFQLRAYRRPATGDKFPAQAVSAADTIAIATVAPGSRFLRPTDADRYGESPLSSWWMLVGLVPFVMYVVLARMFGDRDDQSVAVAVFAADDSQTDQLQGMFKKPGWSKSDEIYGDADD